MELYNIFADVSGVHFKEMTITAEVLFQNADNKYIAPLTEIFKDDDCLTEVKLAVRTQGIMISFYYDNAIVEIIRYDSELCDIFGTKFGVFISCRGRVSSYIYELQNELCDYVLWLDEQE